MSLLELLITSNKNAYAPPLASVCQNTEHLLEYHDDPQLFEELYHEFNNYSLELTISPKSSPLLSVAACGACGATSILETSKQHDIMETLLEQLITKFKINILGVTELYKDKVHIHTHNVINNINMNAQKRLKKFIKNYYQLDNKIVVNLTPINSRLKYQEYMMKDFSYKFHYYNQNPEHLIDNRKENCYDKNIKKNQRKLEIIYNDPIKLHKYECIFKECPICDWIKTNENVSQSNENEDLKDGT